MAANPDKLEEVRATETQVRSKKSPPPDPCFALAKVSQLEKQQILEFESQLAAASSKQLITEQSSLLLSTITR